MTKELQKALIRTILCERDRIDNEIYKERKRIYDLSDGPIAAFLLEADVKMLSSLYEERDYCSSLLSVLSEYYRPKKQDHLGKKATMIMEDEIHVTASLDDLSEKPKITRPTDKDIERIRYELDRAGYLAHTVNVYSRKYFQETPLFLVETAHLLESISNALTEFNAVFPKK